MKYKHYVKIFGEDCSDIVVEKWLADVDEDMEIVSTEHDLVTVYYKDGGMELKSRLMIFYKVRIDDE